MNKRINTEIIINASRQTVWNVLTDFAAYPEWNPFIVKMEGDLKMGGRLKATLKSGEKLMVFKPQVVALTPTQSFSWLGALFFKGLFDGKHSFAIEEVGNGQVKLTHGEDFSGIMSAFILKKIGADTRNNFVLMNQALKKRAESI